MSEYSASAPVVARKQLPKIMMPAWLLGDSRKLMPRIGLNASSTTGLPMTYSRPAPPRNRNQNVMTGPNAWPILDVPARCTAKSRHTMMSVMITTFIWLSPMMSWTAGMVRRPSIAVVMVTAGVSTPSASSAAPPSMAGMMSHLPYLRTMLYRAKIPPSPWLSALRETSTYFTVVSSVTVQMTSERAPRMNSSVTVMMPPWPARRALVTYMGDVPMSPYTTPSVMSIAPMLTGIACEC